MLQFFVQMYTYAAVGGDLILNWVVALGVGALLVEAFRAIVNRRKLGADYADVISKTAVSLLDPLKERIQELEGQVEALEIKLYMANQSAAQATKAAAQATKDLHIAHEEIRTQSQEIAILRAQEVAQAEQRDQPHQ